jgi:hypothetical protein
MSEKILPYHRGKQLLSILAAHAPLSVRGVECIVKPEMDMGDWKSVPRPSNILPSR